MMSSRSQKVFDKSEQFLTKVKTELCSEKVERVGLFQSTEFQSRSVAVLQIIEQSEKTRLELVEPVDQNAVAEHCSVSRNQSGSTVGLRNF
jgi:hypothetical protein